MEHILRYYMYLIYVYIYILTFFFSILLQVHLLFMRYISVCCVVGIIAGFCIGPGKLFYTAYLQKDKILERTLDKL